MRAKKMCVLNESRWSNNGKVRELATVQISASTRQCFMPCIGVADLLSNLHVTGCFNAHA